MHKECENVLDYFNDQLSDIEKRQFEKHLETCQDCREELEELQILTNDLPFSSEPVHPPEGMKDRVLHSVFAEEQPKEDENLNSFSENREERETVSSSPKKTWAVRGLAAALALSMLGNLYTFMNESDETVSDPPPREESTDTVTQSVQLQGESTPANASASIISQNNRNLLTVQAEQLDQLQGEEVYQVWLLQGEKPYRAGTFVANENGKGAVAYSMESLPEDVNWDAIAITKEPDATSQTPQGDIILSSSL